ncbi:CaiB/BaiF CoA-transferase family protein [soil metagenome]
MESRETTSLSGPYYPLQGIRVLEFCWVWAGPFLGQFLADLGAEVIKIDWYDRYDLYRTRGIERLRGKIVDHVYREMSPSFHSLNRNKLGFAVNLKHASGVDLVKQLAAKSDLVIENWSSRTLERLGVGYEALKAVNPALTMLSLSSVGPSSRLEKLRSYGLVTSSLGGAEAPIEDDGEFVGSPTFNISDPNAALYGLIGAMAAIIQSRQSGKGMELIVSQLEAVIALMADTVTPQQLRDGIFECADGKFVAVAFPQDSGPHDLEAWCRERSAPKAVGEAESLGGQACEVINVVDTAKAAAFADLEVHLGADHPTTGREELIAAPWRINGRRAPLRKSAPLMAEGNSHILRNILGLPEDEIARLKEAGAI